MRELRYWSTHLLTGEVLADWLPLDVDSFSRTLGEAGDLSATLDLRRDPAANGPLLAALEPRRTLLWVSEGAEPVWAGVVWDWPHNSIGSGQLPIQAKTLHSLFARREIREDLAYTGVDPFDIARALVTSAITGKGPSGRVAALELTTETSTATASVQYAGADSKKVLTALQELAGTADLEFDFAPTYHPTTGGSVRLVLGQPRVGRDAQESGLTLTYPGNVADYAYPRTGGESVNDVRATATASSDSGSQEAWISAAGHGVSTEDLAAGYPLLEETVSLAGTVTGQAEVDAYADTTVASRCGCTVIPEVKLAGDAMPALSDLDLGSTLWLSVTSELHPSPGGGRPGLVALVRLVGWTATPPGADRAAEVSLKLGDLNLGLTL